jgi:hypothetical protein
MSITIKESYENAMKVVANGECENDTMVNICYGCESKNIEEVGLAQSEDTTYTYDGMTIVEFCCKDCGLEWEVHFGPIGIQHTNPMSEG